VASTVANDVVMRIAGLWRYGDWRHVATGCNALVIDNTKRETLFTVAECHSHGRMSEMTFSQTHFH